MLYSPLHKIYYKNNENYEKIYQERFCNEFSYQYDFYIGKHQAFLEMNLEILNLVTKILMADKKLMEAASYLPKIALKQYTKKCMVDEIQLTNEIEGVRSTRREINEIIEDSKGKNEKQRERLYGLVQKYMRLMSGEKIDFKTCQDIRSFYDEFVLTEVSEESSKNIPDGILFRKEIVEIVTSSQKIIHQGLYPEEKIISAMTSALRSLYDGELNYFVNIAVFHYMFGYIHPFYDGNGRMARFISSYLLNQKLEPLVGFTLSNVIKNKIKKYYTMFNETNDDKNKGDLTPFVIQFLEFVEEAIESLRKAIDEKTEQLDFYINKIKQSQNWTQNMKNIVYILVQNTLFGEVGMDIKKLSIVAEMGESTVRDCLKNLPEAILIVDKAGRKYRYTANLDAL